jgi:hypothetical protein
MTTLVRSRRNDNVLIGFFVILAVVIVVRAAALNVATIVAGAMAIGLTAAAVWANAQPSTELRITPTEITLVQRGEVRVRLDRAEANAKVQVRRTVHRGQASFSLVAPELPEWPGISLDGFPVGPEGVVPTCHQHGWEVVA